MSEGPRFMRPHRGTPRAATYLMVVAVVLLSICSLLLYLEYSSRAGLPSPDRPADPVQQDAPAVSNDVFAARSNAIVTAIQKIEPAVVSIGVSRTRIVRTYDPFYDDIFDLFFRDFFPRARYQKEKIPVLGSGVLIAPEGYILTNEHVIHGADEIKATLADGREFEGTLVDSDQALDIAVLKINAQELPVAPLGDSDDLLMGEWVIALGNPFGNLLEDAQPTATVGVVSATCRTFTPGRGQTHIYKDMIQTDAAINPGNSGGPLANAEGEVIGINTFIFTRGGGSLGIGFAIPINRAKKIVDEIMQYGKVRDVWFGFEPWPIAPEVALALQLKDAKGVIIGSIMRDGPATKAGLQPGDIIRQIDERPISTVNDVRLAFSDVRVGDTVNLEIMRQGRTFEVSFLLEELKVPR